jgi:hypothetical protein
LVLVPQSTTILTTFQALIEEWLDYGKAGGLSPKTFLDYRDFVTKFYWWWTEHSHKDEGKEPHPADVTTKHVREFAAYLRTPLAFRWGTPVPIRRQTLSPTTMIGQGVSLYDLKGLMGHTDVKTTQVYHHDNVDRFSEVYRRCSRSQIQLCGCFT